MLTLGSDTDGSAPTSRRPVRVLSPRSALPPLQARPQESENTSPRVPQLQPLRELVLNARTHLRRASWSSGWEIRMGEAEGGSCRRRRRSGRRRPPEVVDSVIFRLGRWWGGAIMDVRKSARGARLFQLLYRGQLRPHIVIPALFKTFWSASEAYRFRLGLIGYDSPHRGMSERLFPTGARARAHGPPSSWAAWLAPFWLTLLDPSSLILRSSGTTSCQNALLPGFAPQPQRCCWRRRRRAFDYARELLHFGRRLQLREARHFLEDVAPVLPRAVSRRAGQVPIDEYCRAVVFRHPVKGR